MVATTLIEIQTSIVETIIKKDNYMLTLKVNKNVLHAEVRLFLNYGEW